MHRLALVLLGVAAGCRPAAPARAGGPTCLRIDARLSGPDAPTVALVLAVPLAAAAPPWGGDLIGSTWASSRPVHGLSGGTARLARSDRGRVHVELQPMPVETGVHFAGAAVPGGPGPAQRWTGAWLEMVDGVPDTVGTFAMAAVAGPCLPGAPGPSTPG